MCISNFRTIGLVILVAILPWSVEANIDIGAGTFALGSGTVDLGCGNLAVASDGRLLAEAGQLMNIGGLLNTGEVRGGQGQFQISGLWSNKGSFIANQSTVHLTKDCSTTTTIAGQNNFWQLLASNVAKRIVFISGDIQQVQNALVLRGVSSVDRLSIRSSSPGQPGFMELDPSGSQDIFWVDVADNHAPSSGQPLAPGFPEAFESVDSGGNLNWFADAVDLAIPIPTLAPLAIALLGLLMLLFGLWQQRIRKYADFS